MQQTKSAFWIAEVQCSSTRVASTLGIKDIVETIISTSATPPCQNTSFLDSTTSDRKNTLVQRSLRNCSSDNHQVLQNKLSISLLWTNHVKHTGHFLSQDRVQRRFVAWSLLVTIQDDHFLVIMELGKQCGIHWKTWDALQAAMTQL